MKKMRCLHGVTSVLCCIASGSGLAAAPLAVFETDEHMGRDWPHTMVTYEIRGPSTSSQSDAPARFDMPAPIKLSAPAKPDAISLVDSATGEEAPFQLSRTRLTEDGAIVSARLSFMAALPKNARYRFELLPEAPKAGVPPAAGKVTEDDFLTLDNGVTAVRLPRAGTQVFDPPLAFATAAHQAMVAQYGRQAQAGTAPGPIQGVRLADGRWVGGSYFRSASSEIAPRVLSCAVELVEQGPLFMEAGVRYVLDGDRSYEMTVRLLAGDPAIRFDERYDFKPPQPDAIEWQRMTGWQPWLHTDITNNLPDASQWQLVISLTSGWQKDAWKPDASFWQFDARSAAPPPAPAMARLFEALGFPTDAEINRDVVGGPSGAKLGFKRVSYDQPASDLYLLEAWVPWGGPHQRYIGLFQTQTLAANPPAELAEILKDQPAENAPAIRPADRSRIPFLAVVPMHPGNWRQDGPQQYKPVRSFACGDVAMHWPLGAGPHWQVNVHTGEYDPELPYTFGRRQWALVAGPLQYHDTLYPFRWEEGFITLNDYKDWILDWPEDKRVTYPRLATNREHVERLKPRLAEHPADDVLCQQLYFNDDDKRRADLYARTSGAGARALKMWEGGLYWNGGMDFFRNFQAIGWVHDVDELLSSPKLSDEQRKSLRRQAALWCYMISEPDFQPRGSMTHLGNPSMPMCQFFSITPAASLIPDHPMAKRWLDVSSQYLRYKLALNVAPGGAWAESITYLMGSHWALFAALTQWNTGALDETTARLAAQSYRFATHLLSPPDPRFGARTLPGWGHEGQAILTGWMAAAGLVRDFDPDLARSLVWGWNQLGQPMSEQHGAGFEPRTVMHADLLRDLPAGYTPSELRSVWLPGFGASLRAHPGDTNETWLSYRQGYTWSHSDANQGDFYLYSKGTPFVTASLFGYAIFNKEYKDMYDQFGWHNRVRFGTRAGHGGWPGGGPVSQVHAHSLSDSMDYLRGLADFGPQRWTRQILFLKGKRADGPNYFVFREGGIPLNGDKASLEPTFWTLRTMGDKTRVQAGEHGLVYTAPAGQRLDVRFLAPVAVAGETREGGNTGPLWAPAADNWVRAGSPVITEQRPKPGETARPPREVFAVSSFGPIAAGQDITVALYPCMPDEKPPVYETLADGVMKIVTSEGTDYVFAGKASFRFNSDDVAFEGMAGAVRVYPDEVHLVLAEGPGEVRYRGVTLRGSAPAVRVVPLKGIDRQHVIEVPEEKTKISFALTPNRGDIVAVQPGVRKQEWDDGVAYAFESETPLDFNADGVTFRGRRGGVEVNRAEGWTRLALLDGEAVGFGKAQAHDGAGPYELVYHHDHIVGRSAGQGRFVLLSFPPGLRVMPELRLDDGATYLPGVMDGTLMVPLLPGARHFEIHALKQPDVFRNWQAWE